MYKIKMRVVKRNGNLEEISFDKVIRRIRFLKNLTLNNIIPPLKNVDEILIAQKVVARIYDKVETSELDELAARISTSMVTTHPEYLDLASRIIISNSHKNTSPSFSETIQILYNNRDNHNKSCPLIAKDVYEIVIKNKNKLNDVIDYNRDYKFNYFSYKTLEKAYLLRLSLNKKIIERPQHLIMRVSLGIHKDDIKSAIRCYHMMSNKYFTHATPTLFHSGTPRSQFLSCFLLGVDDSIKGIYKCISDCAAISKWSGGIGIHINNIRSKNSLIRGTNGNSDGIIPMLKVFNDTALYVNQSGRRAGSFAMYLSPWHADILEFLDLKKNHGDEQARARDLFYGLMLSNLFMRRVKNNEPWSLFNPDECPKLDSKYGKEFEEAYHDYESTGLLEDGGLIRKQLPAQELWNKIIESQIETGTPYLIAKDSANRKSNQKNIGTIKSSNLCAEILEYSDDKETACCTLSSIALPAYLELPEMPKELITIYSKDGCIYCDLSKMFLKRYNLNYKIIDLSDDNLRKKTLQELEIKHNLELKTMPQIFIGDKYLGGYTDLEEKLRYKFNFKKLYEVIQQVVINLDLIIDLNFYPTPETKLSNMRHRPLGIGVQGLTNCYMLMRHAYESPEAMLLNKQIFATMYYGAMTASIKLAKEKGRYSSFEGSPLSQGKFQFDLWGVKPLSSAGDFKFDWEKLRQDVMTYGARNSLLIALMPTASTAQILGNTECFEIPTSNLYSRSVLSGDFLVINQYLLQDLLELNIWQNKDLHIKDQLIYYEGEVMNVKGIPSQIKKIYKSAFEMSMKPVIDQSADRGPYVCQSQSLNLFFRTPSKNQISAAHFYGFSRGLKTMSYYIRTTSSVKTQQFSLDPKLAQQFENELIKKLVNKKKEDEKITCTSCSG